MSADDMNTTLEATDPTTRERLLRIAGQVFAEKGLEAATVREICGRAEVNLAAVHYHFGGKERLYIESVKHAHGSVVEGMKNPVWPPGTPPAQRLRDFITGFISRLLDPSRPPWLVKLMMREMAQPTEACAVLVRDNILPIAEVLRQILQDILPAGTPRWKLLMVCNSIISQCVFYCQNRPIIEQVAGLDFSYFEAPALAEHISRFTLAALGLEKPMGR
jgi:AcrR family transcriptional regulator